ncbi:hypothetical protein Ahy_A08g038928 isoform D [Arachis hypogaea]|uniref:Uncharacterized protein n=1 Tax=Arachis hypogaea TaxID=3818 RepID=A0A445BUR1_ARAHY|nr:hypothetical protein Ahy_A08g038928 isoform D [Arachis hypogaea]
MVITNFNGVGVGFGFGVGCGFGVGWGFGELGPSNLTHCQVQLKAMGLVTLCFPSDHCRKAKLLVPDGIEDAVNVTV